MKKDCTKICAVVKHLTTSFFGFSSGKMEKGFFVISFAHKLLLLALFLHFLL